VEVLRWSKKDYKTLQSFVEDLEAGADWHNEDLPRCLAHQIIAAADDKDVGGPVTVYYESRLEGWGPGSYYVYRWRVTPASGTLAPLVQRMNAQYPRGDARAVWDAAAEGDAAVFTYKW
jgi:hypothetical protein